MLWSYNHGIVGDAPPILRGGTLFISAGLYIHALNSDSGELIWKAQVDDDSELKGRIMLISNNQLVANHIDRTRGWNIDTGSLEWEFVHSSDIEPRKSGNHTVTPSGYAFSGEKSMYFILDQNGALIYSKPLDRNYLVNGVSYYNQKLYVTQTNTVNGGLTLGRITAYDGEEGDSLWSYDTEQGGFTIAAPIFEEGVIYAGAIGNSPVLEVVALNAENGELIWNQTDFVWTYNSGLGPGHVYINTSGSLVALDKTNGTIVWRVQWEGSDFNKPVYLEGYVYHIRDGELLVINDGTGEVVHREPVPDDTYFWHLAVSEDKLFAQTSYQLIAYEAWHLNH